MNGKDGAGGGQDGPSNAQRALYTFLGYSLVGSFLAGFVTLAGLVLAQPLQLGGLIPAGMPNAGVAAIAAFVWSAIPASLAGLVLAAIAWWGGTFPWVTAAAAGGFAFMLAAIAMPLPDGLALTPLTALAAFIAIGVRAMLHNAKIIL
ncbi:MAG TPA: hypothetical protein P5114_00800 [Hyphomicrobiaceae bacterium]|nr:hypothetical protein [Hyphomicrobiaceae bacterium]